MTNTDALPTAAITPTDETVELVARHYTLALLWSAGMCDVESCEDRERGSDCEHTRNARTDYSWDDFSADDQTSILADVFDIISQNVEDFREYVERRSVQDFGHDFALTRNGHGAGFWDRGLGKLGDRLTTAAQAYGESTVSVEEDGVTLL